jgi:hypothetical protein
MDPIDFDVAPLSADDAAVDCGAGSDHAQAGEGREDAKAAQLQLEELLGWKKR